MSRITEVTAEAFEKLKLKTVTFKQKRGRFTKQIKQDNEKANKLRVEIIQLH